MDRTWRTWGHKRGPDNQHVRQQRDRRRDVMQAAISGEEEALTRSSLVHQAQRGAPFQDGHRRRGCRSRRHVDQLSSASACGGVPSSSSSESSAMVHTGGPSSAGSGSICFANKSPVACSSLAFSTASWNSSSLWARKRRQPVVHAWLSSQKSVSCLVHDHVVERAVDDGAGKRGARLRLDAALGHVAGLPKRSAVRRDEHDVKELRRHGDHGGLLAMTQRRIHDCPSLLGFMPRAARSWSSMPSRSPMFGMGPKGSAARWGLQFYTHVWVCAVTQDQQSEKARVGTPEQRLRTAVSAHQKTHSSDAAIRKQRAFDREARLRATFMRSARGWRKVASKKHLHA